MEQSKIIQGGNNGNVSPIYRVSMSPRKSKHFLRNTQASAVKIHALQNHPWDVHADPLPASKIHPSRLPCGKAGPEELHTYMP